MPLKPGQLVLTQTSEQWQSTKYWDTIENEWTDIKEGSACLIISVDLQKVMFTHSGRMYSIHNCYNAGGDTPVWCRKL